MTRPLRIEYPGAIYHVLSRGDRREAIVSDDTDRELFLDLLGRTCRRTAWQIHAFCVMSNHFHLVVETPRSNLSAGMQWFLGSYTQQFNRRYHLSGHLFGGRYKALLVDGRDGEYLCRVKSITTCTAFCASSWLIPVFCTTALTNSSIVSQLVFSSGPQQENSQACRSRQVISCPRHFNIAAALAPAVGLRNEQAYWSAHHIDRVHSNFVARPITIAIFLVVT